VLSSKADAEKQPNLYLNIKKKAGLSPGLFVTLTKSSVDDESFHLWGTTSLVSHTVKPT
jgi:hypothetical protein